MIGLDEEAAGVGEYLWLNNYNRRHRRFYALEHVFRSDAGAESIDLLFRDLQQVAAILVVKYVAEPL
jgi:hypothetical protein